MERGIVRAERAEHFIGRDVVEPVRYPAPTIEPDRAGGFQQAVRPDDVGIDENVGARNRAVDMALGGKVNHGAGAVLRVQAVEQCTVAASIMVERAQVGHACPRIGERQSGCKAERRRRPVDRCDAHRAARRD